MPYSDTGWIEWREKVLSDLRALQEAEKALLEELTKTRIRLGQLEVRATLYGAVAGGIPAILWIAASLLPKK